MSKRPKPRRPPRSTTALPSTTRGSSGCCIHPGERRHRGPTRGPGCRRPPRARPGIMDTPLPPGAAGVGDWGERGAFAPPSHSPATRGRGGRIIAEYGKIALLFRVERGTLLFMRIGPKPVHGCTRCPLNLGNHCWAYAWPRRQWHHRICPGRGNAALHRQFREWQEAPQVKSRKQLRQEAFRAPKAAPQVWSRKARARRRR